MADDDRYLTGEGEIIPEQRSASYSTNTSLGPFSGGAILSGQDEGVPMYGGRFTTQLPEGLSATLSRTNQAGETGAHAVNALRLAKQIDDNQLALSASRMGEQGLPSYGLQYSGQIGKQGGAKPYYPAPSGNWYVEAGGTPSTPERHIMLGAKGRFADGGTVEAALHAIRHHLAGGGFLSDLFSGPDYQSTGEVASPTNWGDPESAADFFRADKALRLAREVQAKADDVTGSVPSRAPLTAPRPGAVEVQELPVNIPFAAPERGASLLSSDISPASITSLPLAYTATPIAAPAAAAIDQATGKLTARAPQGPDLNDRQRDLIIRTIAAETSGKTPEESQAIAHVILNRIQSGSYGDSPEAVLFAKNQFEPWSKPGRPNYPMRFSPESRRYGLGQTALDAALGADDITNGATNFWAPKAQAALGRRPPKWGRTGGVDIGETRFHNLSRAEGGLVDDAIHVVREHHADGERVGMDDPRQWLQFGGQDMDRAPAGLPIGQAVGTSAAYHTAEGLADATKLANQVMEGEVDPMSDEGIQRALGAAMVAQTGGLGGAPEGAVLGSGPIRAYHGSPHQFERFDINKIGTGEGAQAYGHGLYLAEHEPTAKFYRDALSDMVVGEKPFNINDPLHKASSILHDEALGDRGRAISIVQNQLARDHDPFNANVLRILKTGKDIPAPVSSGHMYEVNINANPEHFLNWDMPFAGQSKTAQDAIKYAFGPQPGMATFGSRTMDIPRAVHTRLLLDKGIPGIKYLDAESRGMTAKPTHNYVIFNDKLIDINRRYAQGGDVEPASVEDRALMLVSKQA